MDKDLLKIKLINIASLVSESGNQEEALQELIYLIQEVEKSE